MGMDGIGLQEAKEEREIFKIKVLRNDLKTRHLYTAYTNGRLEASAYVSYRNSITSYGYITTAVL